MRSLYVNRSIFIPLRRGKTDEGLKHFYKMLAINGFLSIVFALSIIFSRSPILRDFKYRVELVASNYNCFG